MLSSRLPIFLLFVLMAGLHVPAGAHFQLLVPSQDIVAPGGDRTVSFEIAFTHPMAGGPVMEMDEPREFGVLIGGEREDLGDTLEETEYEGRRAYSAEYTVARPGAHIFHLETAPYWEAAEGVMISQYVKVVVDGLGAWGGWDRMVGFPVEIEPLSRPYGLWTGNIFRGVVRKNGEPVPGVTVEVEYYNEDGIEVPADAYYTQLVRTDENGIFAYAIPREGWWGFAAVTMGDEEIENPEGESAPHELGAVMWVYARDME